MTTTLHELAVKLQDYIISQQRDAHNVKTLNRARYNNLKIQIKSKYTYPNLVVSIGIAEAVFDINEHVKTEGSLGQDDKYILKWLMKVGVADTLNEHYENVSKLKEEKMNDVQIKMQGEAEDVQGENYRKRKLLTPKNDLIILDEDLMSLLESDAGKATEEVEEVYTFSEINKVIEDKRQNYKKSKNNAKKETK